MAAEYLGKIVEHWDVLQIIPETSEIDNGVFCSLRAEAGIGRVAW